MTDKPKGFHKPTSFHDRYREEYDRLYENKRADGIAEDVAREEAEREAFAAAQAKFDAEALEDGELPEDRSQRFQWGDNDVEFVSDYPALAAEEE